MTSESQRDTSQSFEHMRMKLYFYENIPLSNNIVRIEEEYKIANQIIDVYVELADGAKIAIEIQHSKISDTQLIKRTLSYTKNGIYVLWILDGNSFNRTPQNQDGIKISKLEILLHKIYHGRVYYVNIKPEGLLSGVYTLTYAPYFNIKDVVYKKKASSKRCVYHQQINNLKLICTSNKYNLAMFEDVSIKSYCEQEIYNILKMRCKEMHRKKRNEGNNFMIIPIIEIVSLLQEKYGFYLVYDILRRSKTQPSRIKIARLGFMKDTTNKIRECIKIYFTDYLHTDIQ